MKIGKLIAMRVIGGNADTTAPTVAITSTAPEPTEVSPIPLAITFSEQVTGFAVGDLTITNGSAANFATSDNIVFTVNITPTAGGTVTVDINAGVCTDLVGNTNTAAVQFSRTFYDTKVNDSFTDTNGTALASHTIAPTNVPGNAWTNIYSASGRTIAVQSNRASSGPTNEGLYGLEVGTADVILSVVLRPMSTTIIQNVYLRLDALTDAVGTERSCWCLAFGNGKFELYERNNSTPGTLRATTNLTTASGTDYTIRVVCIGNTITATVDGANQISYTGITTHLTSTKFGLKVNGGGASAAVADDFKVFF